MQRTREAVSFWTYEGWLYLAVVLDLFSRRVIGWAMAATQDETLIETALRMALLARRPAAELLFHSDRRSQYTSDAYRAVLAQTGISVSMSRTGNRYDNAITESFFGTLKGECVVRSCFQTRREARQNIFEQALQNETAYHALRSPRCLRKPVNQERCRELIQRVLDGKEELLGVVQIAKRLESSAATLLKHFPNECAVITQRMQDYRMQRKARRIAQVCEEVRQAVLTLSTQGIYPSHRRVSALLSQPSSIRQPEASAVWRETRHALGIGLSQINQKR